jgi:hypothetical protein
MVFATLNEMAVCLLIEDIDSSTIVEIRYKRLDIRFGVGALVVIFTSFVIHS